MAVFCIAANRLRDLSPPPHFGTISRCSQQFADTSVGLHGRMRHVMDTVQGGLGHGLINAQPKADLPEPDLLRSIRLFGEKVIPALREPF